MTSDGGDGVSTLAEMRTALAETRRYLLSHHEPQNYHRCHRLEVRGRPVHLCARCSGVYPGIAVGIGLFFADVLTPVQLVLVACLPLPALLDWCLTHFRPPDGSNAVRTVTGGLLGVGYGLGLGLLLVDREPAVLGVGIVYGLVAAVALMWYHRGSA
jgi:uncharacterized membrane protein